ncbi:NUDIX hydrolase [Pilimelia anulata]|uniref:NUDIX hydrolase n=1 Tax=Pilimelia anulata TaxID=53371 RepID=A0A8J3AZL6_9ACTN|nr:NUDIX domain-containing protein [Pilimelia anulata]GGJ75053.1 NUDIX hydrolase [Pilimelia anulata]
MNDNESDGTDWVPPALVLAVDLVILTIIDGSLQVLLIDRGEPPYRAQLALPGGFLADDTETLRAAASRELAEETGVPLGQQHLIPLGVYDAPDRDPRGRIVSAAFVAIQPRMPCPTAGSDAAGARWVPADTAAQLPLAFDHATILRDGVEWARRNLEHTTVSTAFCASTFTLTELQQVYEAVWGSPLDARNFYRKVRSVDGFVAPATGPRRGAPGRPPLYYRAGPATQLHPAILRPTQPGSGA